MIGCLFASLLKLYHSTITMYKATAAKHYGQFEVIHMDGSDSLG